MATDAASERRENAERWECRQCGRIWDAVQPEPHPDGGHWYSAEDRDYARERCKGTPIAGWFVPRDDRWLVFGDDELHAIGLALAYWHWAGSNPKDVTGPLSDEVLAAEVQRGIDPSD